jgi:hypothetical protein
MANGGKSGNKHTKGLVTPTKSTIIHNLTQRLIPESRPHQNVKKSIQALYKMVDADLGRIVHYVQVFGLHAQLVGWGGGDGGGDRRCTSGHSFAMRRTRRRGIWWVVTLVWRQTSCDCCG